jgi:hypothetical protein
MELGLADLEKARQSVEEEEVRERTSKGFCLKRVAIKIFAMKKKFFKGTTGSGPSAV